MMHTILTMVNDRDGDNDQGGNSELVVVVVRVYDYMGVHGNAK